MFGYLPFNQSENNAVLEPRREHFRGLVGSRLRQRTSKCVLEAKDVLEHSILVDSVEQEHEQQVCIELDDFDKYIDEKEDTDFFTD